jgi:hypothetical protein
VLMPFLCLFTAVYVTQRFQDLQTCNVLTNNLLKRNKNLFHTEIGVKAVIIIIIIIIIVIII